MASLPPRNVDELEKQDQDAKSLEKHEDSRSVSSGSAISGSSDVVFEDYLHYAAIQRLEEDREAKIEASNNTNHWFYGLSAHKGPNVNIDAHRAQVGTQMTITQEERANASRALRLASWAMVFYLITTDILGPFNAPFAISQVGWVPGIILYVVMGGMALYTGLILWRLFVRLDSPRYPLQSYADLADRIFGARARNVCNILQSIQLLINVGTICLSNGQSLAQITKGKLCFSVCILIWTIVGFAIGQVRTLKNYSWLANSAVWLNLLLIFLSMGFISHSPPNFAAAAAQLGSMPGPVQTHAFGQLELFQQVNGIMNMVFAYGGAMIFPEMMAEMRRPMDFWKGMACAQMVIFAAYLMYGAFVYSFQGQFTLPLAYLGVTKFAWQTIGNVIALITGIIAAGLYGNIGIKVVYINVVERWMGGPSLMTKRGNMIWSILVFVYWSLAFVVGSAIPQVSTITALIAAIAIMQFTYTFPPILRFGYDVITDAMSEDRPHVPNGGAVGRIDTWRDWSRWKRGLFTGRVFFKLFNLVLFLAGTAMACLGMWGAGKTIVFTFQLSGHATSFGCNSGVV